MSTFLCEKLHIQIFMYDKEKTNWSCKYFVDNKFESRFECEKETRDEDCYERNDKYDEY